MTQTIEATLNQCYGGQWLLTAILHSNLIPHMSVGFSGLFQSVYKLHVGIVQGIGHLVVGSGLQV